jgi:hypothetical protein
MTPIINLMVRGIFQAKVVMRARQDFLTINSFKASSTEFGNF